MVDNSTSLSKSISGRFFVIGQSGQAFSSRREAPSDIFCWHMYQSPHDMALQSPLDSEALKRKPVARGRTAPRALSIVEWFFPLPWLESGADSAAPDVCPLALAAAQASRTALRGGAQNDSKPATTPNEPTGMGTAAPSPRSGGPALPRHGGPSDSPVR